MRLRRTLAAVIGLGLVFVFGCGDSEDSPRSVLTVVSLNGALNADFQPLLSDLLNLGPDKVPSQDDFIVEDSVPFIVRNDPRSDILVVKPGGPFGRVTLNRYVVEFQSAEQLGSYEGRMHLEVHTGREVAGVVTIVPAQMKIKEPLLSYLVGGQELLTTAKITFYGVEATSGAEVMTSGSLPVHFANWDD
jgi:hypothetical protein